ncbi:MAG: class II fructose-bisphosphate aldolase [bacterium]|nr:class II fructose-bisphosphate aldolase [bacterium]
MNLIEAIRKTREGKSALGHFNISDIAAFRAIVKAAGEVGVPVIIGTSEGEAEFVDIQVASEMVKDAREETGQSIFLNADHFRSLEKAKEAVEAGYDSVIFDGANLPLEENIQKTKRAVDTLKAINPDVLIEGELGYIGVSSKLLDEIPEGAQIADEALPTVEDARRFVEETGVDLLAPAVGNIHGMFKHAPNPKLNIRLIESITKAVATPLVLHGGSGVSDADFRFAIEAGMRVVHINTEIRVAWRKGMEEALGENQEEIAPYKIFPEAERRVYEVVVKRLKLFGGLI